MIFGPMSRATIDAIDAFDELFERLARSGEVPPYLADVTPAGETKTPKMRTPDTRSTETRST